MAGRIPPATPIVLADPALRASIAAWFDANRTVAAAPALSPRPETVRSGRNRIAARTGRNPHQLADPLEPGTALRHRSPTP